MMISIAWTKKYPSQILLRRDIKVMIDSFLEILFSTIPKKDVDTVYFKGSAAKEWDSILDYVPLLSDVDIQILFKNTTRFKRDAFTVEKALNYAKKVEILFKKKNPHYIHIPRVQFLILNDLEKKEYYIPSPAHVVKVYYGNTPYHSLNIKRNILIPRARLRIIENVTDVINRLPGRAIDKNSDELYKYVNDLGWRISSCVPNMLIIKGFQYDEVWDNRTKVLMYLREIKEYKLASDFTKFYYHAWQYFLKRDIEDVRKSLIAGDNVLRRCMEIAKKKRI